MTIPVLLHAEREISGKDSIFSLKIGTEGNRRGIRGGASKLSPSGLLLEGDFPFAVGSRLLVELNDRNRVAATIEWANSPCFGCHFDEDVSASVIDAVLWALVPIPDIEPGNEPARDASVTFGANLRRLRKAHGVSRRVLAEKIGVSIPTISMWERDLRRPVINRLNHICEILGVSVGELMTGTDAAEPAGFLAQSREHIARVLGTTSDKVRITIEI